MHIHRIHNEHQPFPVSGGSHLVQSGREASGVESVHDEQQSAKILQSGPLTEELSSLLEKLRALPEPHGEAVTAAQARVESGALFSREAAELVATSLLQQQIF